MLSPIRWRWAMPLGVGLYAALGEGLWRLFEDAPGRSLPLSHRLLLIVAVLCGMSIDLIRFKYAWKSIRQGMDFGFSLGLVFAGTLISLATAAAIFCGTSWDSVVWCLVAGCLIALYGGTAGAFAYTLLFLNLAILAEGCAVSGHLLGIGHAELALWSNLLETYWARPSIAYQWLAAATATVLSSVILWARPLSY